MAKKCQIELAESGNADVSSTKLPPMTFDEIAAIIQSGDSEKLEDVIDAGRVNNIDMRSSCEVGVSLLMVACKSGFIECARVLLDHKAFIRANSTMVLKNACLSGNADMVRLILERGPAISDSMISYLLSPEIIANTEIAATIVEYIQDINAETSTFLHRVCRAGNPLIARIPLERGALLILGRTDPLVAASGAGHLDVVKLLLGWRRNDVGISRASVNEAFTVASRCGHVHVVRCLIEYGSASTGFDADTLNNALYAAVEYHRLEVTALLLDYGGDYEATLPRMPVSIRIRAFQSGSPAMVYLLLDRGADPNALDAKGWSPPKAAIRHPEVLKMLLEHNADPNQLFADGSTALLDTVIANNGEYMSALTILLGHGADPNLPHATTGQTALMVASLELRIDAVKMLLEYSADVTQVNREGQSVLDMLGEDKYREVRELCTQYIECNKPGVKLLLK